VGTVSLPRADASDRRSYETHSICFYKECIGDAGVVRVAVVYARRTFALQKNVTALMTKIIIMFSSIAFEINSSLLDDYPPVLHINS